MLCCLNHAFLFLLLITCVLRKRIMHLKMFLALSPTPTSFLSFLLTHNKSSGFHFISHSEAPTESLTKKFNPSAPLYQLQFSHLESVLLLKFFPFVFPYSLFLNECSLSLGISTVIECSEASGFRELANIQYAVYFVIFSLPPKEVFYMFGITVVIFYSKDILPFLFITLNSLS